MRERKPQHFKLGSDQVGDADARRTPLHNYKLVATRREVHITQRQLTSKVHERWPLHDV